MKKIKRFAFIVHMTCFALCLFWCSCAVKTTSISPTKSVSTQNAVKKQWKLVWSDEFNKVGLPDTSKWGYDVGGQGWGNNEWQYYTEGDSKNVWIQNGVLSIIARKEKKEGKAYSSTRMVTRGKADFTYGRIEIRAKLPKGRGTWPAGWMLGSNLEAVGWPLCGEIDILEHVGFDPDTVVGSIHTVTYNHIKGTQKSKKLFIKNPYTEFHTYSIEWTAEQMDFLLDGVPYLTVQNEHKTDKEWPFNKPQYLLLNLAIGGNWGGEKGVDDSIFPVQLEVDYVRVFQ